MSRLNRFQAGLSDLPSNGPHVTVQHSETQAAHHAAKLNGGLSDLPSTGPQLNVQHSETQISSSCAAP